MNASFDADDSEGITSDRQDNRMAALNKARDSHVFSQRIDGPGSQVLRTNEGFQNTLNT